MEASNTNNGRERLNGSTNEKYGLARSLSVMPGDVVNLEVYGKYIDTNPSNWTGALSTLMGQIASGAGGVVIDGVGYSSSTTSFPFAGMLGTTGSTGGPKAYLNWLIFDKNYNLITGGYSRMSSAPSEHGQDAAFERLYSPDLLITEPGYVYAYLSNEETTPVEVYFDDFKVTHTKSPVVQMDDYYPFGLTFNSYSRENSLINNYQYNGKEKQDELSLGWLDYGARMYLADIGRWNGVDPLGEVYHTDSPYSYTLDNPMKYIDPDGREVVGVTKEDANKLHQDINTVFAGEKFNKFRSLITQSGKKQNGKEFNKIDGEALKGALEGLEGDDLALAGMVAGAINSKDVHKVEFAKIGDELSSGATEAMNILYSKMYTDNNQPAPTMPTTRTADQIRAAGGSGQNFSTSNGSHSVILEGAGVTNSGGRRELDSFHEVFGHGIPAAANVSSEINNRHAIQTENLVRRVLNIKEQRDGSDHSGGKVSNPSGIPK